MINEKRNDKLFVTVGGIIESEKYGKLKILMQKRFKKKGDTSYNDTLEIPSGHVKYKEKLFDALKREVKEETGLDIIDIKPSKCIESRGKFGHTSINYLPFCVGNFLESTRLNIVFLCKTKGKIVKRPLEDGREQEWFTFSRLKDILDNNPERIFTHNLAILKYYVEQKSMGQI